MSGGLVKIDAIAQLVPQGARVLDLGCGSGAVGRHLAARGGAGPIDGLTISPQEAELAAPHYRRVEVANLESADLTALFAPAGYDIIVCADVLEHIRHPEHVLAQCRALLAAGGREVEAGPQMGMQHQQFATAQRFGQRQVVGQEAQAVLGRGGVVRVAGDRDAARTEPVVAGDAVQGGGLSAAGGPGDQHQASGEIAEIFHLRRKAKGIESQDFERNLPVDRRDRSSLGKDVDPETA